MIKINNREYDWGSIAVVMWGRLIIGITGIEYKTKKVKEAKHGAGRDAKSIQHGKRECEGTLTLMQSEVIAMNQAARAKGYKDLLDVDVDIIVTYSAGFAVTVDKITCASFSENGKGMKEGDLQAEISLAFIALDIDEDITAI